MAAQTAPESRSFLQRAVRFLAEEARVDQFLDIGAGLPTAGSTHEIAQRRVPHARVLYVDNDPALGRRARALLAGPPPRRPRHGDIPFSRPRPGDPPPSSIHLGDTPPGSAPTGDTLPGSAPTGDTLPGSAPTGDTRFGDAPLSAGPLSAGAGGRIRFIEADLRDPASILTHPQFKETVDLSRPVALILIAVLHLIPDQDRSREIVHELLAALPSGSYLAATSLTLDFGAADTLEPITGPRSPVRPRTRDEFAEFFTGLGLIGPGIVPVSEWLPEVPAHQRPPADQVATYGALGRKP